jgi:hypothetical protein
MPSKQKLQHFHVSGHQPELIVEYEPLISSTAAPAIQPPTGNREGAENGGVSIVAVIQRIHDLLILRTAHCHVSEILELSASRNSMWCS